MTTLKPIHAQILGTAIVEILNGELSDEIIAAVDSINRDDVPDPLNNMVGYMHGMSTYPPLREGHITSLIDEIRIAATEVLEMRRGDPEPDNWWLMQSFFFDIFESNHVEDMIEEEIKILPDPEQVEGWTKPLIKHVKTSKSRHTELMLELLDVMEEIIRKRREELKNTSNQNSRNTASSEV